VRTANERAELAKFERELPVRASRTLARIAAVRLIREDMGSQKIVESIENLGDAQFANIGDRRDKVAPEIAQHRLPVDLPVRDTDELLLEVSREVIFDVAPEKDLEKSRHETPLVLGKESLLFHPHVTAIAQHRKYGGVGG